ncbi:MAG: toxic anion resistance protein [Clostridia bacterium]|nr:toxic anion resistance protein [Clostridia bacterium]
MENNIENIQNQADINEANEAAADNTVETEVKSAEAKNPYEELFTPDELKLIEEYAGKISITDDGVRTGYGVAVQKKAADLASAAVLGASGRDDSVTLGLMNELIGLIREMEASDSEKTGILGIFKTKGGRLAELSERFEQAEPVADEIMTALDADKEAASADVKVFGDLYELNLNCIKELTMYIAAAKMKLKSERDVTLVKICEFAKNSGDAADIDAATDFAEMCRGFGERIASLEQVRALVMQSVPRIMLLRNNSAAMCEMIGEINANALGVWKRHAASALGIDKVGSAVKMPGNAFDREFLKTINTEMIDFLGYVIDRYKKVDEDRARAEAELRAVEGELKQLLFAAASQI